MIKIEKTETYGWEAAIRGMRNPKNSWDKSDSYPAVNCGKCGKIEREGSCKKEDRDCTGFEEYAIGANDLNLMNSLCAAGSDHRKFMRMIIVYCDITAPLYWWKEFDTYKVGTVANSCSTMHKIHAKKFTLDDFSHEHMEDDILESLKSTIFELNNYRDLFNKKAFDDPKNAWWQMIQLLPSSYNQKRTVMLNYEVLTNMYNSRKHHKLDEWHDFCDWIKSLPHSELITHNQDKYDSFWEVLRSTYGTTLDDPIARAIIFGEPITEEMIYNYEHSKE